MLQLIDRSHASCTEKASHIEACRNYFDCTYLDKIELVAMVYVIFVVEKLHMVMKNVSHEDGRLSIADRTWV